MKEVLALFALLAVMMLAFLYGLEKTLDNRCEYYKTLDMTEKMKEMCEKN